MSSVDQENSEIVSGRACGQCTLCCKLLEIKEAGSPRGEWCRHCELGAGCRVYSERPTECRNFNCAYLVWSRLGDHWYPARSKMIVVLDSEADRLRIHVDPARPNAWREQPFYGEIKEWARVAAAHTSVVVCVGDRIIVVMPDTDVDLGPVADDERVVTGRVMENGHLRMYATKMRADDPRLQA